jgi:hypothetical protein
VPVPRTSPVFVPRDPGHSDDHWKLAGSQPGGHDGFVVVPALCDDGIRIDVFDAADVGRGPLATLKGPYGEQVPLLLHAAWMPRAVAPARVRRLRFSEDVSAEELSQLPDDLRTAAQRVARDLESTLEH